MSARLLSQTGLAPRTLPTCIVMRGGTETTYTGDGVNGVLGQRYKLHALLATSTLMVESFPADATCDILVVGGGGASGVAGGGGGGVLASSIARFAVGEVPVVIGAGGLPVSGSDTVGDRQGFASSVGPYVAIGGGMGAGDNTILNGWPGASGGGSRGAPGLSTGGFTILASQGNNGGSSTVDSAGGGGGGAGGAGVATTTSTGGAGGAGVTSYITGVAAVFGAGGGGGGTSAGGAAGGAGAGAGSATVGTAGTPNTGGGAGGRYGTGYGLPGGSGVAYVRYAI